AVRTKDRFFISNLREIARLPVAASTRAVGEGGVYYWHHMHAAQAIRSVRIGGMSVILAAIVGVTMTAGQGTPEARPRARDLGIAPGIGAPGPENAITDVAGVSV